MTAIEIQSLRRQTHVDSMRGRRRGFFIWYKICAHFSFLWYNFSRIKKQKFCENCQQTGFVLAYKILKMGKPNGKKQSKKQGKRKGSMEMPDGAISQEELEKIINHQNGIPPIDLPVAETQPNVQPNNDKKKGETGEEKDELEKYPEGVLDAVVGVLSKASGPEGDGDKIPSKKEKLENGPGNIFEKAVLAEGKRLYDRIQKGLDLIRRAKAEGKKIEIAKNANRSKINFTLFNDVSRVNPDAEDFLAELEKLGDFQNYPFDKIRDDINNRPKMIAIKESKSPKKQKDKEYGKSAFGLVREEIKKLFFEDEIAGTGRAAKIANHIGYLIENGLVELVDASDKNEPTPEEKRKEQIRDIVRIEYKEVKAGTVIKRALGVDNLADDIFEIEQEIKQREEDIINEATDTIEKELADLGASFDPEKIKNKAFERIRTIIIEYAKKYLSEKKEDEKRFSPEQMEELRDLLAATRKYRDQLEEAELRKIIENILRKKCAIPEEKIPDAIDFVAKWEINWTKK